MHNLLTGNELMVPSEGIFVQLAARRAVSCDPPAMPAGFVPDQSSW